jgi:hypothetical protein
MRHGESLANGLIFMGPLVAAPAVSLGLTQPLTASLLALLLLALLFTKAWNKRKT